jgi:hypothetical protein
VAAGTRPAATEKLALEFRSPPARSHRGLGGGAWPLPDSGRDRDLERRDRRTGIAEHRERGSREWREWGGCRGGPCASGESRRRSCPARHPVWAGALWPANRMRPAPPTLDGRARTQEAALRHAGDALSARPAGHRPGDRQRTFLGGGLVGPHRRGGPATRPWLVRARPRFGLHARRKPRRKLADTGQRRPPGRRPERLIAVSRRVSRRYRAIRPKAVRTLAGSFFVPYTYPP